MAGKKNVVSMNQDISSQVETLRDDLAQLTKMVKEQASAKITDKTAALKETAQETTQMAKAKYADATQHAETQIKENPLTAVAIAVGAGFLIGALSRR